ncbi:MAG: hypothetical protein OFPII_16150 [Osedax symbiont Rs1]|nr:MAG: hypothetical protein OFPII_16150 [Osedax symbiont Rs1]
MQQATIVFDTEQKISIVITETFKERNRGLFTLAKLQPGQGLLITPCRSVHSFGMAYAIDLLYLNKQLQVVKIISNMLPNRMSLALRGYSTLELLSGEAQRLGIGLGSQGKLLINSYIDRSER